MDSICDHDDLAESIAMIIKRLNRRNQIGPRSNDPGRVLSSVPTPRRNTEIFIVDSKNRFDGANNT